MKYYSMSDKLMTREKAREAAKIGIGHYGIIDEEGTYHSLTPDYVLHITLAKKLMEQGLIKKYCIRVEPNRLQPVDYKTSTVYHGELNPKVINAIYNTLLAQSCANPYFPADKDIPVELAFAKSAGHFCHTPNPLELKNNIIKRIEEFSRVLGSKFDKSYFQDCDTYKVDLDKTLPPENLSDRLL